MKLRVVVGGGCVVLAWHVFVSNRMLSRPLCMFGPHALTASSGVHMLSNILGAALCITSSAGE